MEETYEKMDPELKTKWLAALRSGEYEQGRTQLRQLLDSGGVLHCCLGVLDTIAGTGCRDAASGIQRDSCVEDINCPPEYLLLPFKVQKKLWCMNDTDESSFLEIADWIEANL